MVATYKLLDSSDPKLKIKLDPIEEGVDRLILKNNLIETMNKHNAFGLAAIQCGVMQRVFAMCSGENKKVKTICFNPEIIWVSEETSLEEEGCLSYPNLYLKIRRPVSIKVTYDYINENTISQGFDGLESRIFQHEYDHVDGIDFTNKASPLVLKRAKKKLSNDIKKMLRKYGNA